MLRRVLHALGLTLSSDVVAAVCAEADEDHPLVVNVCYRLDCRREGREP